MASTAPPNPKSKLHAQITFTIIANNHYASPENVLRWAPDVNRDFYPYPGRPSDSKIAQNCVFKYYNIKYT
jgi:hypothetical protein